MSQFINVGGHFINLDNVTEVCNLTNGGLRVFFATSADESKDINYQNIMADHTDFEGDEADALRWYFDRIAADVLKMWRAAESKVKLRTAPMDDKDYDF